MLLILVAGANVGLPAAQTSARLGNADVAISQAKDVLAANPKSAEASSLLCSLYGSLDMYDDAIRSCEAAFSLQPNSANALHLARAYGARADHAGAFTGMRMVGRIRENFQKAVELDPNSVEALSDLGEFYIDAPGMVGGGLDKARALLPKLQALSPARYHRLAGMIASHAGDDATAEKEYAAELAVSHSPEAYVDLANFFKRRKMWTEAAHNAVEAIRRDAKHGPDSLDAARILIGLNRDVPVAQKAMRDYLSSPQSSTVKNAARVHTQLGQSLAASGDNAGAQAEFAAALQVAANYQPARKAVGR